MSIVATSKQNRVLALGAVCVATGFAAGILAAPVKKMAVVPIEQAQFMPVNPSRPDGPQLAVLWGDAATGPSSMLLRFARTDGTPHVHSSDYHLVVLEGTMKHWGEGQSQAEVKPLAPGSYWFQPGEEVHADACLSDECLMFVQWAGKRDARLAPAAR